MTRLSILYPYMDDFNAWRKGAEDFDIIDYAMCVASPDLLALVLGLAEPEVVLHDGEYFLAHGFRADIYWQWLERLSDKREVQKVMNHIHLTSLLQEGRVPDDVASFIGQSLARIWSKTLRDKHLVAKMYGSGFDDVQVTFFRR